MRNKSIIAKEDIYNRMQKLEDENKRLKASNFSSKELEQIIKEN